MHTIIVNSELVSCYADFASRSAHRVIGAPHCFRGAPSISTVPGAPNLYFNHWS